MARASHSCPEADQPPPGLAANAGCPLPTPCRGGSAKGGVDRTCRTWGVPPCKVVFIAIRGAGTAFRQDPEHTPPPTSTEPSASEPSPHEQGTRVRCSTRHNDAEQANRGAGRTCRCDPELRLRPHPRSQAPMSPAPGGSAGVVPLGVAAPSTLPRPWHPYALHLTAGCQAPPGGGGLLWRAAAARKQPRPHRAWAWHKRGPSATPTASPTVPRASALSPPSASVWLEVAWPPQLHPQAESEQPVAVCSRGAPVPTPPPPTLAWPWFARPPQGPT